MGVTKKVDSISILLLQEGGVVEDRGGRRNNVCSYFFVNDRIMYSPTTSPYGYSSFLKEESLVTIDFWRIFMGPFCLAVQSPSARCSIPFASLLSPFQLAAESALAPR